MSGFSENHTYDNNDNALENEFHMIYPEFIESKTFYSRDKSKTEFEQLPAISEDLKIYSCLAEKKL
ncbi:MAG: hypothetical protein OEY78_11715, partial [Gammaproteobacteria bacterium]|nr:hypothetical protein [Gammaproteobacteria bacterium]